MQGEPVMGGDKGGEATSPPVADLEKRIKRFRGIERGFRYAEYAFVAPWVLLIPNIAIAIILQGSGDIACACLLSLLMSLIPPGLWLLGHIVVTVYYATTLADERAKSVKSLGFVFFILGWIVPFTFFLYPIGNYLQLKYCMDAPREEYADGFFYRKVASIGDIVLFYFGVGFMLLPFVLLFGSTIFLPVYGAVYDYESRLVAILVISGISTILSYILLWVYINKMKNNWGWIAESFDKFNQTPPQSYAAPYAPPPPAYDASTQFNAPPPYQRREPEPVQVNADFYNAIGQRLLDAGHLEEGIRNLLKALEMDPNHRPTQDRLVVLYYRFNALPDSEEKSKVIAGGYLRRVEDLLNMKR